MSIEQMSSIQLTYKQVLPGSWKQEQELNMKLKLPGLREVLKMSFHVESSRQIHHEIHFV